MTDGFFGGLLFALFMFMLLSTVAFWQGIIEGWHDERLCEREYNVYDCMYVDDSKWIPAVVEEQPQ